MLKNHGCNFQVGVGHLIAPESSIHLHIQKMEPYVDRNTLNINLGSGNENEFLLSLILFRFQYVYLKKKLQF